jgi:hypothetical protein
MKKEITKAILALAFLLASSCQKPVEPYYILSQIQDIKYLEKQDHQLCVSLKLNIDGKENFKSAYYWRCRLSFAKYRLATGQLTPMQSKRNLEISDLITKISLKISETSESFLTRETKKIDNLHHNQCLNLGFSFETEDQSKIDEYFFCRKALIEEQQVPPFGNQDYKNYPNHEYNLSFAVDQRLEDSIKLYREKQDQYPTCVKYNIHSINFTRCVQGEDKSRLCASEIDRKRFKKEWEEKIICQKQAYTRFSDDLLKKNDDELADNSRKTKNSDFYNKNSFAAIGVDGTLFASQEQMDEINKQKDEEKKKSEAKKTNSKAELYNKFELTKLRQKHIFACQKNSNKKIDKFADELKKSCEDLKKFEVLGEE